MKKKAFLVVGISTSILCAWSASALAADGAPALPAEMAPATQAAAATGPSLDDLNKAARAEIVARLQKAQSNLASEENQPSLTHYAQIYPSAPKMKPVRLNFITAPKLQAAWADKALGQLPATEKGKLDAQQSFEISGLDFNVRDQKLGLALKMNLKDHSMGVGDSPEFRGKNLEKKIRSLKVGDSLNHLISAINQGQLDQEIGPISSESQQIVQAEKAAAVIAAAQAAAAAKPVVAVNTAPINSQKPVTPAAAKASIASSSSATGIPQ